MQPFDELRIHRRALRQLAAIRAQAPKTAECLDNAFLAIREGRLLIRGFPPYSELPGYATACSYVVLITDLGNTAVIVGLTPERPGEDQLI